MEIKIRKKQNMAAVACWAIIMLVISFTYVIEIVKGLRALPYIIGMLVLGLVPLIIGIVLYRINSTTKVIRYLILISYLIFYAAILFTSPYPLSVVYVFPILGVMAVFENVILCFSGLVGSVFVVASRVVYLCMQGNNSAEQITEYELELFGTFLVGFFICTAVKQIERANQYRMESIEREKQNSEHITNTILASGQTINSNVNTIEGTVQNQLKSAVNMTEAMGEMAAVITQVAGKLENQSDVTKHIQETVERITVAAGVMTEKTANAKVMVKESSDNLKASKNESDTMKLTSTDIIHKLAELQKKAEDMQEIVTVIQSITENTNLLSLNASIEAARAGEVGKGFAVVASEIRNLAEDTQNSAVDIAELLQSFHSISDEVQKSVGGMLKELQIQNDSIDLTYKDFGEMQNALENLDSEAMHIRNEMEQLKDSNQVIVESITEMSAASEEIAASAKNVEELSIVNKEAGEKTGQQIGEIAD